jgi:hypothetical protein
MGIQDRDYFRERVVERDRTTRHDTYFSSLKTSTKSLLSGTFAGKMFLSMVLGILVLAAMSDTDKKGQGCKVVEFALDQNHDGKVTYRDLEATALQSIEIPIKLVLAQEKATTFTHFLELSPNQCRTTRAIVTSGVIAFILLSVFVIIASVALYIFRKLAKPLIFDVIEVSPYGSWNSRLFKTLYPRYHTLIDLRYIALLVSGLTVIWLIKN